MGNLRGWEWLILLAIVLLLFGARRLPDLARSLGRSAKIFKSEVKDLQTPDPAPGETAAPAAPLVQPAADTRTPTSERVADTPSVTLADDDGERSRP